MRIGIDVHAVERDGSGNSTYMRGLLHGLARVDHSNEYFIYATDPRHRFYAELRALRRFEIRTLRPRLAPLRIAFTLAARSILDRLDILHVQYGGPPLRRGRLVSTIHDVGFVHVPETFSPAERLWMPKLIGLTARRAAVVIAGSTFSKQQVMEWAGLPGDRVIVTFYGVAPSFAPVPAGPAREAILARYGIREPFILAIGRLNSRKNLERVIDAFEQLEVPGVELVIGGQPDFGAEAVRQKAGEGRAIRLAGFIADADLPAVLSAASVFVYPSLFEGFGLPPLEALACGTAVVASNTTALPEVLGDAALLVDPRDVDALRRAIRELLTNGELRATLRARGLARAAGFSWDETARRTVDAYARAMR